MTWFWERWAALAVPVALALSMAWAVGPAFADKVEEGQPVPEVNLPATQIEKVLPGKKDADTLNLKDLRGKKIVVLYFFPKALTGG